MAQPRSELKRLAIVHAAVRLFAERGAWATPTAAISGRARVAEGTLFTYFPTKSALVNAVYRSLSAEVGDALLSAYPKAADARVRFHHLWEAYVRWALNHPDKYRVLGQLHAYDAITPESRMAGGAAFAEIERLAKDSIRKKRIRNHPLPYLSALMISLAQATIAFTSQSRGSRVDYAAAGFEIFWSGITTP